MRKIETEQGSYEWLEWRRSLLTATNAGMLMGFSPYETPFKGWQRKIGLIPEQKSNPAMVRGQKDEPIARKLFIKEYGINMVPTCIESEKYTFFGASLDGLSDCGTMILEVKSQIPPSEIPAFHMMQMQHQMLCCDRSDIKAYYVSHWNGVNVTYEVAFDPKWVESYLPKAKQFWENVVFGEPPMLSKKDYTNRSQDNEWIDPSNRYYAVDAEIKAFEAQIKLLEVKKLEIREELIKVADGENCEGNGLKLLNKCTKGRVDYDSIPVLKEVDLEKYRKPTTYAWTIMVEKVKG